MGQSQRINIERWQGRAEEALASATGEKSDDLFGFIAACRQALHHVDKSGDLDSHYEFPVMQRWDALKKKYPELDQTG